MSTRDLWSKFCRKLAYREPDDRQGVRQIHRNIVWDHVSVEKFMRDENFQLADCNYTKVKLTHLKKYYLNEESMDRAVGKFSERVRRRNRNSAAFLMQGTEKTGFTKNDFCMNSAVLTMNVPDWDITFMYRTTEAFHKFRGDLIFFVQIVIPMLQEKLPDAPLNVIHFMFPNVVIHPMYMSYWLEAQTNVTKTLKELRHKNERLHDDYLDIFAYHMTERVRKFKSAERVRIWLDTKPDFIEEVKDYAAR